MILSPAFKICALAAFVVHVGCALKPEQYQRWDHNALVTDTAHGMYFQVEEWLNISTAL